MTADSPQKKNRKLVVLPKISDFHNVQLDLFQRFLCNT
jgi:hypothetical protein